MDEFDFETLAIHAGEEPDPVTGATRLPLHMATTFKLPGFGIKLFDALMMDSSRPPFAYTRWGNPTLRALEDRLAALEGAEAAVVTASGMAAVSALLFTFLNSGDQFPCFRDCPLLHFIIELVVFGLHVEEMLSFFVRDKLNVLYVPYMKTSAAAVGCGIKILECIGMKCNDNLCHAAF